MTELQETLQTSHDSLKRLLMIAIGLIIFVLFVSYYWSTPATSNAESLFRQICQHHDGAEQLSGSHVPLAAEL